MRRILSACILSALAPAAASAGELEDLAGQVIRDAGYWCAAVAEVIPDQWNSTPNKRVVIVAWDDGKEYARYEVTINRSGTAATVKEL